jgi:isopentenyl-diphosphate Delta-isomerase
MQSKQDAFIQDNDPGAVNRKADHIELAFKSRVDAGTLDRRFFYEPMMSGHPLEGSLPVTSFNGKLLQLPVWVSSMTGGTAMARIINTNLAKACGEFGMGMGLGSCRSLLSSDDMLKDFYVRPFIGYDLPLYANLGIAQVEQLFDNGKEDLIRTLIKKLEADGLIIHVNPLQEWMQPEGDRYSHPPIDTIKRVLDLGEISVIVKEVGQGFGPESMKALLDLPLTAVEFAASGGTNFALLELFRNAELKKANFEMLTRIGHDVKEMLEFATSCFDPGTTRTKLLILSGGINDFLDGFYAINQSPLPAVYGQASKFLKYAQGNYEELQTFIHMQKQGLELAHAMLKVRKSYI